MILIIPQVQDTLFSASYLVLGLGDVYLGAPCAVPLDPRQRLVTAKYNPARTFTHEGTVGIGGCYMCIYPMDSPGEERCPMSLSRTGSQKQRQTVCVIISWFWPRPDENHIELPEVAV